jgi:hypothetical protein
VRRRADRRRARAKYNFGTKPSEHLGFNEGSVTVQAVPTFPDRAGDATPEPKTILSEQADQFHELRRGLKKNLFSPFRAMHIGRDLSRRRLFIPALCTQRRAAG